MPASAPVPVAELNLTQLGVCLAIGSIALLILGVQPVLLGPLVMEGRIAEADVGHLVTIEMLAMAAGSLAGTRALRTLSARYLAIAGGVVLAMVDAAMTLHGSAILLLILRGVAGLAEGALLALPIVAGARAVQPERVAALFLVAQTLLQLAVAAVIPNLIYLGSRADAGFLILAGAAAIAALLGSLAPVCLRPAAPDETGGAISFRSAAALFSAATFLGGIVVFWSYFGLWLTRHGHMPKVEGIAVAILLASQVAGAAIASRLNDRLQSRIVICAAALAEALLIGLLFVKGGSEMVVYAVSAAFGFLWLFTLPSFTGLLISIDPRRRAALYLAASQLGGAALLPTLSGPLIGRMGVDGAGWFGIASFAATIVAVFLSRDWGNQPGRIDSASPLLDQHSTDSL